MRVLFTPAASLESGEFSTIDGDAISLRGKRRLTRSSTQSNKRAKVLVVSNDPTPTVESPDANMVLKYMFGVSEWKRWVQMKNDEQAGRGKPFKMEILQCTADELNFSLCLFVKEARREDGEEYSPDTIYNMCLGGSGF